MVVLLVIPAGFKRESISLMGISTFLRMNPFFYCFDLLLIRQLNTISRSIPDKRE